MGKIKSKAIKKASLVLVKQGIEFGDSFEENKKIIEGITPSKKMRNQMAGLLTRIKKRQNNNHTGFTLDVLQCKASNLCNIFRSLFSQTIGTNYFFNLFRQLLIIIYIIN